MKEKLPLFAMSFGACSFLKFGGLAVMVGLMFALAAPAAVLTVSSLADSGPGTLRQRIADAAPGDTINFAVSGSIVSTGNLVISQPLTVSGPGPQQLSLVATSYVTLFYTSNAVISISGLKISGSPGVFPIAIQNANGGVLTLSNCAVAQAGNPLAGALWNASGCTLNLVNSEISSNRGTIRNLGNLCAVNSSISSNSSPRGGILQFSTAANLTLVNCTLARNRGPGIAIQSTSGTISISNCTIAANHFSGSCGGIMFYNSVSPLVSIRNTIIAGNVSGDGLTPDCNGALNSLDYNLIGNTNGCTLISLTAHNIYNTDAKLGPLDNYGGPTQTVPLLSGSPAIDAGSPTDFPPTDQRGRARPYAASSDIGAFESSPPYVIRGKFSGFTLHDDVVVTANGTNALMTQQGAYSFEDLSPGDYTIASPDTNYLFVPTNLVLNIGPDQVGADFRAYHWNCLSVDGFSGGMMQLAFPGTNGQPVELLASENLRDWGVLCSNIVPATHLLQWTDPMTKPVRFYRAASP